ncbi:MAG: hypothetical protein AB1609_11570 [Bacillota bacterium]
MSNFGLVTVGRGAARHLLVIRGDIVHLARASDWELLCGRPLEYTMRVDDRDWDAVPEAERCTRCARLLAEEWRAWEHRRAA